MNLFEILVTIVGIMMSIAYYPQAYKIWKYKSAKDISKISYWIMGIGTTVWFSYGIYLKNWTIISSFIVGVIGSWLVLILTYVYKK